MKRQFFTPDHEDYRNTVRTFIARHVTPHRERWDIDRSIGRDVWRHAGAAGIIGLGAPETYGGAGQSDYRYRVVVSDELSRAGATSLQSSFSLQDDILIPYVNDLGTDAQKQRWLTGMVGGDLIGAIAMTEPGAGSDLQGVRTTAIRDGDDWVVNGNKTFITSGFNADFVVVVARTDPAAGSRGFSLIVVETGTPGFERGRKLSKVGLHAQDTAELSFTDVRVPVGNLLGDENRGFTHLMERLPRERLSIAVSSMSSIDAIYTDTTRYCFDRNAFGRPIGDFQNTRFTLAEIATEIDVTRAYVDQCVLALNDGTLTAVDAAKAKWWASELQKRVVDRCLQLHGGYGYMLDYPVAQAFVDSRVQTIYGGTTEIMKEIIGRDLANAATSTQSRLTS